MASSLSAFALPSQADEPNSHHPQLLLNAKLLRRLKRDHERQTIRWTNFETRIRTVPDSPERGFELALYVAVTADEGRGKEALVWATAHPCEYRQRALISDWVSTVPSLPCSTKPSLRDMTLQLTLAGADTNAIADQARTQIIPPMVRHSPNGQELYELVELLTVLRDSNGQDIRNADSQFFRTLPTEYLLSLKPSEVTHPAWMTHIAALALVSVDPNLEASQFLQGWAVEDRQTLREGPGVAYELLWADPYLPGIAYQNLDPWSYDEEAGRLFARSDWTDGACWISISKTSVQEETCPDGWRTKQVQFGSMTLIPAAGKCVELPHQDSRQNIIVWKLTPGERLTMSDKKTSANADSNGLWHPGANVEGKVCRH